MAGSNEKTESGVIAEARIQSERGRDAPGVFGIEAETADALGEGTVARAGRDGGGTVGIGSR